jgi:hypothetical protein
MYHKLSELANFPIFNMQPNFRPHKLKILEENKYAFSLQKSKPTISDQLIGPNLFICYDERLENL